METSIKDCWQTPPWLLELVNQFYGSRDQWFDPCPPNPGFDGLSIKWPSNTYINPPFSQYKKWASHGRLQPLEQIWICHHDSSTERMQLLLPGATLCLLFDRISFIHPETGLPKGTDIAKSQTLIYRGNKPELFKAVFEKVGFCVGEVNKQLVTPHPYTECPENGAFYCKDCREVAVC